MNTTGLLQVEQLLGIPSWLLSIILIWTLIWKGIALWKSARKNSPVWFVALLVINTIGILEILYIFLFSKIKLPDVPQPKTKTKRKAGKNRR
jgi:hypothetical protein